MEANETRIVEIPATDTPVPTPKPKAVAKPKAKAAATATKTRGKDMAPKEFAKELGMDPKKLRRHLRENYGTHHKAWVITPAMQKELRAKLGKKAK